MDTKRVVGVPSSVFHMAERHFVAELKALFREHVLDKKDILAKDEERTALTEFSLSKTYDASVTFDEENKLKENVEKDALEQGDGRLLEYLSVSSYRTIKSGSARNICRKSIHRGSSTGRINCFA